jgi:BirA family biotin operon repressor/biotin-[acetyl-CoA-carboxylase] ligase
MDIARDMAQAGAPEGTLITADTQIAGRGRGNHAWYSPPAQSLYLSIVLRPSLPPQHASWITMTAALAVREVVEAIASPEVAQIKWFNDVLLNGRKVCGTLVETSFMGDCMEYAVLGIGLNVNTRFDAAPPDVQARATSLAQECNHAPLDRADILSRLLESFGARYTRLLAQRASPAAEYTRHVVTLGQPACISAGSEIIEGLAQRIDEDGALIIHTASGERRVGFGEILS